MYPDPTSSFQFCEIVLKFVPQFLNSDIYTAYSYKVIQMVDRTVDDIINEIGEHATVTMLLLALWAMCTSIVSHNVAIRDIRVALRKRGCQSS